MRNFNICRKNACAIPKNQSALIRLYVVVVPRIRHSYGRGDIEFYFYLLRLSPRVESSDSVYYEAWWTSGDKQNIIRVVKRRIDSRQRQRQIWYTKYVSKNCTAQWASQPSGTFERYSIENIRDALEHEQIWKIVNTTRKKKISGELPLPPQPIYR